MVTKENLVLEINLNLLVKEDQIDHQEMVKKNLLVTKENLVIQKKVIQNPVALQIIQSILEESLLKIHLQIRKIKALILKVKKNLRVEIVDLKVLLSKNTVKKELKSKTF